MSIVVYAWGGGQCSGHEHSAVAWTAREFDGEHLVEATAAGQAGHFVYTASNANSCAPSRNTGKMRLSISAIEMRAACTPTLSAATAFPSVP